MTLRSSPAFYKRFGMRCEPSEALAEEFKTKPFAQQFIPAQTNSKAWLPSCLLTRRNPRTGDLRLHPASTEVVDA